MSLVTLRWVAPLLVLVVVLSFVYEKAGNPIQVDDAYISYRYAQNLVDGHGLVFNPGERVEGYTNLSWVLLVALGIMFGFEGAHVGFGLALFTSVCLLIAVYVYARVLIGARLGWLAALAPLILYISNPFAVWSTYGLETPLFALCVVCGFIASHRSRQSWVLFWCVLAVLTRPDGVLLAAVLLGIPLLETLARKGIAGLGWVQLREVVLYSFAIVALTVWRLVYYGDFVPNTFHAKVGGVSLATGLNYAWLFLADGSIFLLAPFLVASICSKSLRLETAFLVLLFIYCTYVGGDVFYYSRFYLPVVPLLAGGALLAISELFRINRFWSAASALSVVTAIFFFVYGPTLHDESSPITQPRTREVDKVTFSAFAKRNGTQSLVKYYSLLMSQKADLLQHVLHEDDPVATLGIGVLGYQLKNPILDLLGLTDKTIARSQEIQFGITILPGHQRVDTEYVLSRSPAVILIPKKGTQMEVLPAIKGLWDSEQFAQRYYYHESIEGYLRRDIVLAGTIPEN